MSDLGFGQRPEESMQSGAGDPSYMKFLHGWMRASNVRSKPPYSKRKTGEKVLTSPVRLWLR